MHSSFVGLGHYYYRLPILVVTALRDHSQRSFLPVSNFSSSLIGMAQAAVPSSSSTPTLAANTEVSAPAAAAATTTSAQLSHHPILTRTVQCQCGKVHLQIKDDNPLRFVCYCRDCRGYYQTLNRRAAAEKAQTSNDATAAPAPPPAILDAWGGCDYTHLVHCGTSLRIVQGNERVTFGLIRPNSPIKRVWANCCCTPLFSIGSTKTCLLNSHLQVVVPNTNTNDDSNDALPPIRFRILGRQALPNGPPNRPSMSWSVPLAWFWTMPRRIPSTKGQVAVPLPLEFPSAIPVMDDFREG